MAIPKSKGDAFLMGGIDHGNDSYSTTISIVLRLTPNGLQVAGKEILLQEEKVEGAAYTENSLVIEQLIL
ncbi:MAG: hypothetical protein E8D41_11715 [Nitrospira sp.]|nr:MAG: hypothetical protein E8D41_11715 [Nitrospira sp.]